MPTIAENLGQILERISKAEGNVQLIAVSKTKPAAMVKEAYEAGQRMFGENYVQELAQKAGELSGLDIEWHFIGHLQRNKVRHIAPIVSCIHSLDSVRLAEEIEKRAEKPINCLIEVNLAGESTKTGVSSGGLEALITALGRMKKIKLVGLMTMPPLDEDPEKSRPYFQKLSKLLNEINEKGIYPERLTELSMGMTGDLEVAIEEGATMVRVGTAIFGERE